MPKKISAYKNGDFTDLVISCCGSEFAVHTVIVCSACDFFAKSIQFAGKEANERRIDLQEDDPEMIRRLITYLYLGDYDPSDETGIKAFRKIKQHESITKAAPAYHLRQTKLFTGSLLDPCACLALNPTNIEQPVAEPDPRKKASAYNTGGTLRRSMQVAEPLTIHATMYALADKYQVAGLGEVAQAKFETTLYHHYNSEDFVNATQIAYSSTPEWNRGLRDAVLEAFRIHFQVNVAEIQGLEAKLETIDELSFLLIKSWPKKTEPENPRKSAHTAVTASSASYHAHSSGISATSTSPLGSPLSPTFSEADRSMRVTYLSP
ncbi:BTB domain containing protein [Pyrenophora teres f. maculata]|nr:BTB domain containing protein [Pyrenophora teres f. maculata]